MERPEMACGDAADTRRDDSCVAGGSSLAGAAKRAIRRRVRAVLIAGPCIAMLAVGASLSAGNRKYGTAQQLGLPACSFLAETGWPCPSCGLTTSVTATVHGDLRAALRAQPFGPVLALAAAVLGAAATVELVGGRDILGVFRLGWWWPVGGMVAMLLGWGIKMAVGLADGSLPLR